MKTRKQAYYVIEVKGIKTRLYPPKGKKWTIKSYNPRFTAARRQSHFILNAKTTGARIEPGAKVA